MNLQAPCILSLFGLFCLACGTARTVDVTVTNSSGRDTLVEAVVSYENADGDVESAKLLDAVTLRNGETRTFLDSVPSVEGTPLIVEATAGWPDVAFAIRRGTDILGPKNGDTACTVAITREGNAPAVSVSCTR